MRKELSGIYFTPSFNLFRVYLEYMHANRNVYVYVQFLFFALFIFPLERKKTYTRYYQWIVEVFIYFQMLLEKVYTIYGETVTMFFFILTCHCRIVFSKMITAQPMYACAIKHFDPSCHHYLIKLRTNKTNIFLLLFYY